MGGDLNLTLSLREVWGTHPRQDPLSDFFNFCFKSHNLVEVELTKLVPTLRNFIKQDEAISKSLDCSFVSKNLVKGNFLIKSWVSIGGLFNHLPIPFQIKREDRKLAALLKFNHMWLLEDDYKKLIEDAWVLLHPAPSMSYMQQMRKKKKVETTTKNYLNSEIIYDSFGLPRPCFIHSFFYLNGRKSYS